ncbi:MAG: HIT domain-containing protein [Elusimicrobiota bacterium]|nr:HIT domain-containing protein [Endomicrobiia bacterium]MCX7910248.1 HIT domain-containing protein [Endomicrobiia bacterium]MDW8165638.1 HIT domain-containing protein [Elusimicrobiota bacterium]
MNILWAPWRVKFIRAKKQKGCIFCKKIKEKNDEKNYIIYRGKFCFVILNIYPYNNGHLMIVPYRHIANLEDINSNEFLELFELAKKMLKILKKTHKIEGCNIGLNLGKVSGAGIDNHIHLHLVPRWLGDTNFMPIIGKTKVISEGLNYTYKLLSKEAKKL